MIEQGEDNKNLNELLMTGADMSGSAIGGIISFFMAGPFGAAVGGASGVAISKLLKSVGLEMKNKFLGKREEKKIGATIIYAVEKIQENLKSKNIRNDNFFENDPNNRSSAEELFEATLISAQRDPEERKLKYYGNLLGNIPFFQQVNRSQANHLIKTAQDLSWSQLCILTVAAKKNLFQLKQGDYRDGNITEMQIFLASQAADLYHKGLINFSGDALLGLGDVNPGKMNIQGVGVYIYQLMELVKIPDSDLEDITKAFS